MVVGERHMCSHGDTVGENVEQVADGNGVCSHFVSV